MRPILRRAAALLLGVGVAALLAMVGAHSSGAFFHTRVELDPIRFKFADTEIAVVGALGELLVAPGVTSAPQGLDIAHIGGPAGPVQMRRLSTTCPASVADTLAVAADGNPLDRVPVLVGNVEVDGSLSVALTASLSGSQTVPQGARCAVTVELLAGRTGRAVATVPVTVASVAIGAAAAPTVIDRLVVGTPSPTRDVTVENRGDVNAELLLRVSVSGVSSCDTMRDKLRVTVGTSTFQASSGLVATGVVVPAGEVLAVPVSAFVTTLVGQGGPYPTHLSQGSACAGSIAIQLRQGPVEHGLTSATVPLATQFKIGTLSLGVDTSTAVAFHKLVKGVDSDSETLTVVNSGDTDGEIGFTYSPCVSTWDLGGVPTSNWKGTTVTIGGSPAAARTGIIVPAGGTAQLPMRMLPTGSFAPGEACTGQDLRLRLLSGAGEEVVSPYSMVSVSSSALYLAHTLTGDALSWPAQVPGVPGSARSLVLTNTGNETAEVAVSRVISCTGWAGQVETTVVSGGNATTVSSTELSEFTPTGTVVAAGESVTLALSEAVVPGTTRGQGAVCKDQQPQLGTSQTNKLRIRLQTTASGAPFVSEVTNLIVSTAVATVSHTTSWASTTLEKITPGGESDPAVATITNSGEVPAEVEIGFACSKSAWSTSATLTVRSGGVALTIPAASASDRTPTGITIPVGGSAEVSVTASVPPASTLTPGATCDSTVSVRLRQATVSVEGASRLVSAHTNYSVRLKMATVTIGQSTTSPITITGALKGVETAPIVAVIENSGDVPVTLTASVSICSARRTDMSYILSTEGGRVVLTHGAAAPVGITIPAGTSVAVGASALVAGTSSAQSGASCSSNLTWRLDSVPPTSNPAASTLFATKAVTTTVQMAV